MEGTLFGRVALPVKITASMERGTQPEEQQRRRRQSQEGSTVASV